MTEHPENFPIMGCNIISSIPWAMLAPHDARAQSNHGGQSLKKLASRGGLAVSEALAIMDGLRWGTVANSAANDLVLINRVRAWRAAIASATQPQAAGGEKL